MAALAPSGGVKISIEFVAGTWTDVSNYFDDSQDITIQYGRTSEYSAPQTAAITFRLDNTDGRFTADRQLLADNVTTHPYYPNVELRKRVKVEFTQSATYQAFTGYIKGWVPVVDPEAGYKVQISAATREDKLNVTPLKTPLQQEMLADVPVALWPMSDVSGSTTAADIIGARNLQIIQAGTGGGITFGDAGVSASENSAVTVAVDPGGLGGQFFQIHNAWLPAVAASGNLSYAIEMWFNGTDANGPNGQTLFQMTSYAPDGSLITDELNIDAFGDLSYSHHSTASGALGCNVINNFVNGTWVQIVAIYSQTGGTGTCRLYTSGSGGTPSSGGTASAFANSPSSLMISNDPFWQGNSGFMFRGQLGPVALYVGNGTSPVLSAARVAIHQAAGPGFVGDTTGQRIARYLGYAGLTSSDWNLDTGQCIVGPYATDGQFVIPACQAMVDSEGGGACIYQTPDGKMRFPDRTFQKPAAPVLTFDAGADMDGPSFQPTKDDSDVVNQSIATQASGGETGATFTAQNNDSIALYGLIGDSETSYALAAQDVLNLAQSHVAAAWHPVRDTHARRSKGRLQTVTLDVYTSTTAGLYDLISSVQIGSRIRLINLPSQFPTSQIDVIVEGWTVTINVDKFTIAWVTSAADNPARMLWSDATYSLWGPDPGSMTAAALTTATASTIVVTTAAGHPAFSASSGDYPLSIQIGEEVIKLPTAPSGATSPQTFTGALRGQQGTPASPQAANAPVNVWPSVTWTL